MLSEVYPVVLKITVTSVVSLYHYCVGHSPLWKVRYFSYLLKYSPSRKLVSYKGYEIKYVMVL